MSQFPLVKADDVRRLRRAAESGKNDLASAIDSSLTAMEKAIGTSMNLNGQDLAEALIIDLEEGTTLVKLVTEKGTPLVLRLNEFYQLAGQSPEKSHQEFVNLANSLLGKEPKNLFEKLLKFLGIFGPRHKVDALLQQIEAAKPIVVASRAALGVLEERYKALLEIDEGREKTEQVAQDIVKVVNQLIDELNSRQQAVLATQANLPGLEKKARKIHDLGPTDEIEKFRQAQQAIEGLARAKGVLHRQEAERDEMIPRIGEAASASLAHGESLATVNEMHVAAFYQYFDAKMAVIFGLGTLTSLFGLLVRTWNRALIADSTRKRLEAFFKYGKLAQETRKIVEEQTKGYLEARSERDIN